MCGILGFTGDNSPKNRQLIRSIMLQLSLRGTHATGMAYQTSDSIDVIEASIPATEFLDTFPMEFMLPLQHKLIRLVGHTRYSTSDLQWNQPIERERTAVVMNGVISQEPPAKWPYAELFDYRTGNDAEVALMYALNGMRGQMPGSFAICELDEAGLLCYRNTDRPLWWGRGEDFAVVCSTRDALTRCRVKDPKQLPPGKVYDLFPNGIVPRIGEMDYRPEVIRLGDVQLSDEELLGPDPDELDFPLHGEDLQAAELLYGDLSCLL